MPILSLNEKLDYDVRPSTNTSRQSASSARSKATANLVFKSGDLKAVHLDRAALNLSFQLEADRNKPSPARNSMEKHRVKNEKKKHHHNPGNVSNNGQHVQKQQYAHRPSAPQTITAPCHSNSNGRNNGIGPKDFSNEPPSKNTQASSHPLLKVKVRIVRYTL
jgi:hypothetical protein|tara:strand:- start:4719 stop:5207 length:489 start_codon:yes stop_codon:yes gene_type:complete